MSLTESQRSSTAHASLQSSVGVQCPVPPSIDFGITHQSMALFYGPRDVRVEEVALEQPKAGELLIAVGAALTCGTDLKCYKRGHPVLLKSIPSPFGHECSGTVVAVGDGVTRFKVGDRIVAANSAPCYDCLYCSKGQTNLCKNLDLLNGAYAQYLKIPERIASWNTHPIPDDTPFEVAAFAEPLSIALRGIDAMGVGPGDHVAILGVGAIGQLMVRVAKWKGAHVTALGRNPFRREMASHFGQADVVLDLRMFDSFEDIVKHHTSQGLGFDAVVEVVGLPETWEQSITLARRGGKVNLFGGCASGTSIQLDTRRLHYDELTLYSFFHHTPAYFKQAVELLCSGEIDPRPLISSSRSLAEITDALELVERGQAVKVAVFPHG